MALLRDRKSCRHWQPVVSAYRMPLTRERRETLRSGGRKTLNQRILLIGQIALIPKSLALTASAVLGRPHAGPRRIDVHGATESQAILPTQENSGRALSPEIQTR